MSLKHLLRASLERVGLGLLLAALSSTASCSLLKPSGPSEVARGEYYSAGKPEFDSFFILLHEKQVELVAAPKETEEARESLTRAVALTPDASDESLGARLGQELKKLAEQGLRVRLEVPPASATLDASATLYASETTTPSPLRTALPEQATRLVRSRNRMLATKAELDKIRVMGIGLDGNVDQAFRIDGPWKRDEVRENLSDGQKVITLMQARAQEIGDRDQKLLDLLTSVAVTDPNLGKTPAYTPPAEEAPRSRRASPPRAGGARPAAPSPAPPKGPPSKPPPKRGDDEGAPAPKPTQGSAPAEIEP